ncbi:hypothetical protein GC102_13295 [Paenibacillus sp. LMG 31460]|uniref:Uncharacterized protein n=1 Tax=Paenibacillus germinis TaxID=2654979 RepID=A0ABX1Z023_9BACL|nr:hypothetical protein [Paenibacillus germinis]NOU86743.1 hypothetical protein [Paenibacillus germinis]
MGNTKGRPKVVDDLTLKEMAFQIKSKLKGQKVSFLLLEKETGIGRQTWKRRISEYINELNKPILFQETELKNEEIYLPNIEEVFERNGNNKKKIIQELYTIEETLRDLYIENQEMKNRTNNFNKQEALIEQYVLQIDMLKRQVLHYENKYKSLTISSVFPHLREENSIVHNVLDFKKDLNESVSIDQKQLKSMFKDTRNETEKEDKLRELFPDLF